MLARKVETLHKPGLKAPLPTSGDGYAEQDEDLTYSECQLGSIKDDLDDDAADDPNENMPPTYVESTFQSPNESTIKPLPQAVLIPQRRPGDRRRGFCSSLCTNPSRYQTYRSNNLSQIS